MEKELFKVLEDIKGCCDRATPGPWQRNIKPATRYPTVFSGRNNHVLYMAAEGKTEAQVEADIDFVIRARTALPILVVSLQNFLSEYKTLEQEHFSKVQELDRAKEEIKSLTVQIEELKSQIQRGS